jgi:hypothetical protein
MITPPDDDSWINLAHEIIKPANPESMLEKMKRHQMYRQQNFHESFRAMMVDHVVISSNHDIVIDDIMIDSDSKTVIIQYAMIARPDMNDLSIGDDDAKG